MKLGDKPISTYHCSKIENSEIMNPACPVPEISMFFLTGRQKLQFEASAVVCRLLDQFKKLMIQIYSIEIVFIVFFQ